MVGLWSIDNHLRSNLKFHRISVERATRLWAASMYSAFATAISLRLTPTSHLSPVPCYKSDFARMLRSSNPHRGIAQKLFCGYRKLNSHQNSHSIKIKMAANLAAPHIIDFIRLLAPQVGLEPTTLRLTVAFRDRSARVFSDLRGVERPIWSPFGAKFSQLLSQVLSRFCSPGRGGTDSPVGWIKILMVAG